MTICVAEWLIHSEQPSAESLLTRFSQAYEPWRRYGSGTAEILRLYPCCRSEWRQLSTAMFPFGSYGNGSAMRVAPIGLAYRDNIETAASIAIESSRPTHSHPLAYQGVVLQCAAVALATHAARIDAPCFVDLLRQRLTYFSDLLQDTSKFEHALLAIERGLERDAPCLEMSSILGTGVTAHEAVPMAIYCFLRHADSFADAIHQAVFIGGDADTIACMTGAIAGAYLGVSAIPSNWLSAIREERYSVPQLEMLADDLYERVQ